MARAKLESEPFNLDSWEVIARDAQLRRIDEGRNIFEEIVDVFPTSGKFWKMFIEQEVGRAAPSLPPSPSLCMSILLYLSLLVSFQSFLLFFRSSLRLTPSFAAFLSFSLTINFFLSHLKTLFDLTKDIKVSVW